jgi:hypothetical protein
MPTCADRLARRGGAVDDVDTSEFRRRCGEDSLVQYTHTRSVGLALARLRFAVNVCAWAVGVALFGQALIWSLITFTDLRHDEATSHKTPTAEVVQMPTARERALQAVMAETAAQDDGQPEPVSITGMRSRWDRVFAVGGLLAKGVGMIGMITMLAFITMGALLGASSGTLGVERTVSAFGWCIILTLMVLPLGGVIGMTWQDGALVHYEEIVHQVELYRAGDGAVPDGGVIAFYARFLAMPVACIVGLMIAGLKFASGVEAGLLPREDFHLDPEMEKECANITPASLHGGRTAAAFKQAMKDEQAKKTGTPSTSSASFVPPAPRPPANDESIPRANQISPGDRPKRVI